MTESEWKKVKSIFNSAVELPPEDRAAYLADTCGADNNLRIEVEKLLDSYRSEFLENPANETANNKRLGPGSKLGKYEIVDLLGVGGMGEVYLAKDGQLDRKVAIKFLNERYESNEVNVQRFIQEAKAASALNHPNILTIYEIGEQNGSQYIVSEFVDGHRLRTLLEKESVELPRILNVAIQVAEALSAAHAARIVHRDVKPENIVIRNDGYAKVLDFGLAKLLPERTSFIGLEDATVKQNQTAKGFILGTVSYMSPEQAKGETIDARTDIFSLGVLIYEMVAGRTPFTANSTSETFANLINRDPDPMSRFAGNVPGELQRIVSKMLRKDPDERYQTMKGLLADLREFKDRLSIEAKLQGTPSSVREPVTEIFAGETEEPGRTTVQRSGNRPVSRLVIAAVPILLLGILAVGWYWGRPWAESHPQVRSLAVLPLRSLDTGDNYLGLGITDSIIRRLSSTGSLIVRPTSAVRAYLTDDVDAITAATRLKADAVLEGSLQRSGDRLRVSVNLLRTSDGVSLWTDNFDLKTADVFEVQDTISQKVAASLQLRLDPAQQAKLGKRFTASPEAYENFVKGRASFEQATTSIGDMQPLQAAVGYFKKASDLDPAFALAFAELGQAYMWIANFNDPDNPQWVELALQSVAKAESIDPNLPEIHSVRFEYYYSRYGNWDMERTIQEARHERASNTAAGHMAWGTLYDHLELDYETGIDEYRRALEIDPTNVLIQNRLVESYRLYGKFEEANNANLQFFGRPSASALVGMVRLDEAKNLLDEALAKRPGDVTSRSYLVLTLALLGRQQEAEAIIPDLLESAPKNRTYHHVTYNIASAYSVAGNVDEAVKWLRTTAESGMPNYPLFVRDPNLDRIRQSPQFGKLLQETKTRWESLRNQIESRS